MRPRHIKGNPKAIPNPKFPLLVSYAYLRKCRPEDRKWILEEATNEGFEVLLDSGAFTAANCGETILLDEYSSFLKKYQKSFFGYFTLDVLQDPETTKTNLASLLDQGLSPIPIHVWGSDEETMSDLFKLSDFVGLGGFKRPHRGPAPKNYVFKKMEWANGRNVHWLGYTNLPMVSALTPFSCDCSSWTAGVRYGRADFYLGRGKWKNVQRSGKSRVAYTTGMDKLIQQAGFTKKDFYDDKGWARSAGGQIYGTGFFLQMVLTTSWVNYIMEIRKKLGTRLFLATALVPHDLEAIRHAVKTWRSLNE